MKKLPEAGYLRRTFLYDPERGILFWRTRDDARPQWNAKYAGKVAGTTVDGRVHVILNGGHFKGHRIIWAMAYGSDAVGEIDHVDGNPLNNRIGNLRAATRQQNARNMRGHSASGFKGVSLHRKSGLWRARVRVEGKEVCQYFESREAAHLGYCSLASEHYGEFARFH